MASTYSSLLRVELMGNGDQPNTWGTTANTNLGTILEKAIAGTASVPVTDGADTTLTTANGADDQARCMALNLTGALTAPRNVICPSTSKVYVVANNTTGSQAVTVKTSAGTGVAVDAGDTVFVYCNGTNVELVGSAGGSGSLSDLMNAIDNVSGNGLLTKTSATTAAARTITAGTGITVTNGDGVSGNPTVANAGVTALTAGPGVSVTASTGSITISATGTVTSSFPAGTAAAPGWPVTTDSDTGLFLAGTNTLGFATGGSSRVTIDSNGKATFSATTTSAASVNLPHGTAPSSPVNGDVWTTASGIYARVNGTTKQLDASTGTGTVTSVGLLLPNIFSVTNSPVVSTGTLTGSLVTQTANTFFVGPASGSAAVPTFRALVSADIPSGLTINSPTINNATLNNTTVTGTITSSLAAVGNWVQIESQAITGTPSEVVFDSGIDGTYDEYEITLSYVVCSAGTNYTVNMRTSANGGSTYDSGAADYVSGATSVDSIGLGGSGTDSYGVSGNIRFFAPASANKFTCYAQLWYGDKANVDGRQWRRDNAAIVNAVRFFPDAGTFTSGTIKLFGRKL